MNLGFYGGAAFGGWRVAGFRDVHLIDDDAAPRWALHADRFRTKRQLDLLRARQSPWSSFALTSRVVVQVELHWPQTASVPSDAILNNDKR